MATFVHLTPEKKIQSILRAGIKPQEVYSLEEETKGVFCMPLTQDYFATHQWLRELKRQGQKTFKAVHFKLPDNEEVWFGKYGYRSDKIKVKASEAVKLLNESEDKQGLEIIITRKILPKEIVKVVDVNKNVGWRYYPGAHNTKLCKCRGCISTRDFKGKSILRKEYFKYLDGMNKAKNEVDLKKMLYGIKEFICTKKSSYSKLEHFTPYLKHESASIRLMIANILEQYFRSKSSTKEIILNMCKDTDSNVRYESAIHLYYMEIKSFEDIMIMFADDDEVIVRLKEYYSRYVDESKDSQPIFDAKDFVI